MPEFKDVADKINEVKESVLDKVKELATKQDTSHEEVAEQIKEITNKFENMQREFDEKLRERPEISGLKDVAKDFSWGRAVKFMTGKDNGEDCSFEAEVLTQANNKMGGIAVEKTAAVTGNNGVDFFVPTELQPGFIELALAPLPLFDKITMIPNVGPGNLQIPVQLTRPDANPASETGHSTNVDYTWGNREFSPKRLSILSKISNQSLMQSSVALEPIIRNQMFKSMRNKMHKQAIKGTGANNEIAGVTTFNSNFTTSTVSMTSNAFTAKDAGRMPLDLQNADHDVNDGRYAYLMRPGVTYNLRNERIPNYSGQTNGTYVFQPLISTKMIEEAIGYDIMESTHLAVASNLSSVLFGDWSEVMVPIWQDMRVNASNVASDGSGNSAFTQDQTWITINMYWDLNIGDRTKLTEATDATEAA